MTNSAYQATEEDVANVIASNMLVSPRPQGLSLEQQAADVFADLDFDLIEQAALYGDSLDEQTDYANDEIARQLRVAGVIQNEAAASTIVADRPRG